MPEQSDPKARELMGILGWGPSEAARRSGIPIPTVSRLIQIGRGRRYPELLAALRSAAGERGAEHPADSLERQAREITGAEPDPDVMEMAARMRKMPLHQAAQYLDAIIRTARTTGREDTPTS